MYKYDTDSARYLSDLYRSGSMLAGVAVIHLEYSYNKYCNLIGQNDATNQLRSLQVY